MSNPNVGLDYIKIQNQGSIIRNLELLNEMFYAKDSADENGYYSKRAVAEIGVRSLRITTGNKVREAAASAINAGGDESRNSVLQNAKMRMQILRVLGLVSADYGSEDYAITQLGEYALEQFRARPTNFRLLRELFLNISSATENYEHNCSPTFSCFLGYAICYALASLDYKLSTFEMPVLTTYDIRDIDEFVETARKSRMKKNTLFTPHHKHFPKKSDGSPINPVSNLTRSINQLLRVCNIIKPRVFNESGRKYYVCTDEGIQFVKSVKSSFRSLRFLSAYEFRKRNNITEQKAICVNALNSILFRGGVNSTPADSQYVFSPFQMLPETSVNWFLNGRIRKPPVSDSARLQTINATITINEMRLSPSFKPEVSGVQLSDELFEKIQKQILELFEQFKTATEVSLKLKESQTAADKNQFYPFIHTLLRIIGLQCDGEVGRYDGLCKYMGHDIPVEIKSCTETKVYNAKGVRQAIENKILTYSPSVSDDLSYASLLIGFEHPDSDAESRQLIDLAFSSYKIKIVAIDLYSLIFMATKRLVEKKEPDLSFLQKHGLLMV